MDYYHIEGFDDWCMYARNKYGLKIDTWVETPCSRSRQSVSQNYKKLKFSFECIIFLIDHLYGEGKRQDEVQSNLPHSKASNLTLLCHMPHRHF